ncbi:MAG: helix-turn-helix transcriptional regulator [Lachnospiraceae bacterium]|nr:helix-turn-helix transcriptional regulator [Lachnospiraceae bacterium]
MNHKCIGKIIKEYRVRAGMSRKELAENICSEKYVYFIEKCERSPSVDMTRMLGDKLGVDLFEYCEYIDCIDPIEVNETIKLFNKYRAENNLAKLKEETDAAMLFPDFNNKPWIYEIEINRIFYMALKENKPEEAIKNICNLLKQIEPKYTNGIWIASAYALLSMCYQMKNDFKKAKEAILPACVIIKGKQGILKYSQVIITVKLTCITMLYACRRFDETIEECKLLIKYQTDMSAYERLHYTFFYIAFAFYDKGMREEGIRWFEKALSAGVFRYKPTDIYYISLNKTFGLLMADERLPRELITAFKKMYNEPA